MELKLPDMLNTNKQRVFKSQETTYKYGYDVADAIQESHWTWNEFNLSKDVAVYNSLPESQRRMVDNIMRGFVQSDVQAESGWSWLATKLAPVALVTGAVAIAQNESTHYRSYSLFGTSVGLPDSFFQEFLKIPELDKQFEYLEKAVIADRKVMDNYTYVREMYRAISIFSGALEGIELMTQFALLLLLPQPWVALDSINLYSILDESQHSLYASKLAKTLKTQANDIYPNWIDDKLEAEIRNAFLEVCEQEKATVKYYYEDGDHGAVDLETALKFTEYVTDRTLILFGHQPEFSENPITPLPELDIKLGTKLGNMFETTVTEYNKIDSEITYDNVDAIRSIRQQVAGA